MAGITQYIQTKMTMARTPKTSPTKKGTPDFGQMMQKQMLYFFPIFTVFILFNLPSAIALYWLIISIFTVAQQHFTFKRMKHAQPA